MDSDIVISIIINIILAMFAHASICPEVEATHTSNRDHNLFGGGYGLIKFACWRLG